MKEPVNKERRTDQDRRQKNLHFYESLPFQGKRRALRRAKDWKKIPQFDHYHPALLVFTLTVLFLSLLDAALTLTLIHRGAVELNPVMRYYLSHGPAVFIMVKYGLTAFSLVIMVALHAIISMKFGRLSSILYPSCIMVFGAVIIWELYLLTKLNSI